MIEQSILPSVSGKTARSAEGKAAAQGEAALEAPPKTMQDFAAIMLAQQDLEGELLGGDIGKPLPPSGKHLPDDGEVAVEGAAPEEAASLAQSPDPEEPSGLSALAKLPELPSYRDIPILPPPSGARLAEQVKPSPASPASPTPPATSGVTGTAPTQPTAQPAAETRIPATPQEQPAQPLRASDLQLVVTKAPGFSKVLEERAATIPLDQTARGEKAPAPVAQPQSLTNLYGKKAEQPAAPTGGSSVPAPALAAATPAAPAGAPIPVQATQPAQAPSPQAIETLVERLVQARETAQPGSARLSVANSDFGTVALRFDNGAQGLSVSMTNADPEFAATARTALAERVVAAGETPRGDLGNTRGEQQGQTGQQGSTSANQSQTQHNGTGSQERFQPPSAQTPSGRETGAEDNAASAPERDQSADTGLYI